MIRNVARTARTTASSLAHAQGRSFGYVAPTITGIDEAQIEKVAKMNNYLRFRHVQIEGAMDPVEKDVARRKRMIYRSKQVWEWVGVKSDGSVCTYVYIHKTAHINTYTHIYTHIHTHINTYTHAYTHIHTHINIHTQRGWLEADILMGAWAAKYVPGLTEPQLDEYEVILNEETIDVFNFITGKS
jgi:succinate dehydrogenase flavin-adding protein (antitoxin of CptAB toxin-antitoxin module)